MSNSHPPKLNYVKARLKSKTKNQHQSQQKISFQADSTSDIFAHLNQDNLNYIKKQLKNKKSHKPENNKSHSVIQQKTPTSHDQTIIHQQKVYDKYKNSDQVTQRDSREEETHRQTSVDDSISSDQQGENSKNIFPLSNTNSEGLERQQQTQLKDKQMAKYLGLQPPPLTYKKQSLTSNEGDNIRHMQNSLQFRVIKKRQTKDSSHKNPFQEYELKSQASNNPIGNSTVSVENHLSQDLSTNLRPSQFIDRLQNYIEELNLTPEKTKQFHSHHETISVSDQQESRNFKKNITYQNNQQSIHQQAYESQRTNLSQQFHPIPIGRFPQSRISDKNGQNQLQSILYNKNSNQQIPNKSMIKNYKKPLKIALNQNELYQNQKYEELQSEVRKEKMYCMKLAVELEKYKQNQEKYRKQILFLNKSMEVLKMQVFNLKQVYQKQVEKTTKIISYIQNQHQFQSKSKINRPDVQRPNQNSKNYNYQSTGNSSLRHRDINLPQKTHDKQFENILKFSPYDSFYADMESKIFHHLNDQFKKGQQLFHEQKGQRYPSTVFELQNEEKSSCYKDGVHQQGLLEAGWFDQNIHKNSKREKSLNKFHHRQKVLESSPERSSSFKRYKKSDFIDVETSFIQGKEKQGNERKRWNYGQEQRVAKKERSSLERLKKDYELFKAQAHFLRPEHKKIKSAGIADGQSPRQFTHVFVK